MKTFLSSLDRVDNPTWQSIAMNYISDIECAWRLNKLSTTLTLPIPLHDLKMMETNPKLLRTGVTVDNNDS